MERRCVGVSCGVDRSPYSLLQGANSHTEKHIRGQSMCRKIANTEEKAFVWILFAQVNMLGKSRERE